MPRTLPWPEGRLPGWACMEGVGGNQSPPQVCWCTWYLANYACLNTQLQSLPCWLYKEQVTRRLLWKTLPLVMNEVCIFVRPSSVSRLPLGNGAFADGVQTNLNLLPEWRERWLRTSFDSSGSLQRACFHICPLLCPFFKSSVVGKIIFCPIFDFNPLRFWGGTLSGIATRHQEFWFCVRLNVLSIAG